MKEVRIIAVHDHYNEYDEVSQTIMREGITDWEQVSDDEFKLLKQHWWRIGQEYGCNIDGARLVLIEKDPTPVHKRINSIREWLNQEQARQAREEAVRQQQAQERLRKKLLKTAENERKLLEKLREKYPND